MNETNAIERRAAQVNAIERRAEETDAIERRAAALAEVGNMYDSINALKEENAQLKADLHRSEDRIALLVEQCDRSRYAELKLRKYLNELTTQMSNIVLLAHKAVDYVQAIDEMDSAATPPIAEITELERETLKAEGPK